MEDGILEACLSALETFPDFGEGACGACNGRQGIRKRAQRREQRLGYARALRQARSKVFQVCRLRWRLGLWLLRRGRCGALPTGGGLLP
jgi:hypothetical protein